ncbi:MotA/TolQ/ExbB proton channel family protein [Marinobacter daepoensis]|uniref:MotA/TolQ/ExbB proton channel family protein n=1 Tax=Marinobacter daepoensis TaxID=262077 RepID=A0ABS3BE10_9GAMM|nr:MotA/TolQ/ExbB proton channel family protein [Marinobacter daepoensis]MBN7769982.1 MotA/TolQ/ExbB proton channel family protein [Marinobacter daepoensis]MBY6032593.1 MotA/TolQ/ExbB proton channel family protein [Marinobacter daepoensis]MBY6080370.1 MotA/TolQ/ExbB proton channel family protein [Marinobacter daepoensis]
MSTGMLPDLGQFEAALAGFFQAGGPVLWALMAVSLVLWTLLLDRLWFRWVGFPRRLRAYLRQPEGGHRGLVRADLLLDLQDALPLIRTLIALCPLIGLLGTVTGMIHLFDTLALNGTGNPRLMAAGVARATLPTLAGMVVAVSGLLLWNRLARWSQLQRSRLDITGVKE